jgi:hypothetical protein
VERRDGAANVVLRFADGSSRAIQISRDGQYQLTLFTHALRKLSWYDQALPEPTTPSDVLINLLGKAAVVEGPRFIETIASLCAEVVENRKTKAKGDSR